MADDTQKPAQRLDLTPEGWTNAPTQSDLKDNFLLTRTAHDAHVADVTRWLRDLRPTQPQNDETQLTNTSPFTIKKSGVVKKRSTIRSKLIRKQAEWRYTSLSEPFLNTPDVFNVDPVTFEDAEAARQNALVLNNQFNTKLDKVTFVDQYIRTCVDEGTVIVKTGWDYKGKQEDVEYPIFELRPVANDQEAQIVQGALQEDPATLPKELAEAVMATQAKGVLMFPEQTGVEVITEEVPVVNQPCIEICHYDNVYVDPSANGKIKDAEFVIYSFETNKSDLEERGIYKNLDQLLFEDVNSDADHHSNWATSGFEFSDKARKKFVVYEYWGYWDIDGSGVTKPIVASWVGNVMIRLEENPFPDGELPFVSVPFMPIKDQIYGEPDAELLIENQEIEGALKRGMVDVFGRSANAQTGFRKGALDAINKKRFESGLDYEYNDVGDAQQSIYMHQFPEVPQSVYNFLTMQQQDADSMSGVQSFSQGITGVGLGSTAAAANGALSAAARRELGILRRLAEGMKEIGRKTIAMNQEFLSEEEVIRVTNKEFVTVRKDDLAGRFDLRLSISTAEADEQKASELSFMLQTTAQSMGPDFTRLIQAEIADLRKMPELAEKIRNFQPTPDPMAQKMAELELALKQAEVDKEQAETQKILAEAQLAGVKSGNTQADTDKKNLDFVQEEAGITHARDLDKMSAQAEAQTQTKLVEAAIKEREARNKPTTESAGT